MGKQAAGQSGFVLEMLKTGEEPCLNFLIGVGRNYVEFVGTNF